MLHYSTKIVNKNIRKTQLWIVTQFGEVLLKPTNDFDKQKYLKIKDITLEAEDLGDCTLILEKEWGIKDDTVEFNKIYSFISEVIVREISGYTFEIILDLNIREDLLKKGTFEYIDYRDLDDKLKPFKRDVDFNEAYYSLLTYLDKKYGYKPMKFSHGNTYDM